MHRRRRVHRQEDRQAHPWALCGRGGSRRHPRQQPPGRQLPLRLRGLRPRGREGCLQVHFRCRREVQALPGSQRAQRALQVRRDLNPIGPLLASSWSKCPRLAGPKGDVPASIFEGRSGTWHDRGVARRRRAHATSCACPATQYIHTSIHMFVHACICVYVRITNRIHARSHERMNRQRVYVHL